MKKILLSLLVSAAVSFNTVGQTPQVKELTTAVDFYNRGMAEMGYGNNETAITYLSKAIELKPDYAYALANRGYLYNLKKEYAKAIADYTKAESVQSNSVGYYLAAPYANTGKPDEAFAALEKAFRQPEEKPLLATVMNDAELQVLHADPRWKQLTEKNWYSDYEKLVNEGNAKISADDLAGAIAEFSKAIALDAKNDVAYGQRALAYIRGGDFNNGLTDLNQAISLKPKSVYFGNRAYILKKQKNYKSALEDYQKAEQLDPHNIILADRAMVRYSINPADPEIVSDLKAYLAYYYRDDFNYFMLGSYYYQRNNSSAAIPYLNAAIEYNATVPDYYLQRGQAQFALKNLSAASMDFSTAISVQPDNGEAYYLRGVVKGEERDKTGACEDWRKAEQLGYKDENGYIKSICE